MEEKLIKKLEEKLNKKIPKQNFKYVSDYTLDGFFQYVVFESQTHKGRKITTSLKIKRGKYDEKSFTFNDPGFNESDTDFDRICSILDDLIPKDKYCVWLTGYFEDTKHTVYQKEKKVYPRAAFGIWIDPNFIPKDEELVELCKDCGVLALSVEYLPSMMFKDWTDKYDTKEIVGYHHVIVEDLKRKGITIQGKDYCFKKPFRIRKEGESSDKGYLKSECY